MTAQRAVPIDRLIRLYKEYKGDYHKVATAFGLKPNGVRRRLKAVGVHTRKLVSEDHKRLMVRLYNEGVSVTVIQRVFDVSQRTVYAAIRAWKWRNFVSPE